MRASWRIVLAIVLLAAGTVLFAPAALLDAPLASRTGKRLRLVDASGWWWLGRAAIASHDGAARVPVAWRVAWAPLLAGTLVVTVGGKDEPEMPTGTLLLRDGVLEVRNLNVHAPASIVPAFVPALQDVSLRGDVDIRASSLVWNGNRAFATFDVAWEHAGIGSAGLLVDLGNVVAKATPADGGIAGTVHNTGGDVAIDGRIDARAAAVDVALALTASRDAPDAVRAMLPLLGASDASGRVQARWHADWR